MSPNTESRASFGERQATTPGGLAVTVRDVPEAMRFEAWVDDTYVGFTRYARTQSDVIVLSTVTEVEWRGRGIASAMTEALLALIREAGWQIGPRCPFTQDYLARHPEQMDLVPDRYRELVKPAYRPQADPS